MTGLKDFFRPIQNTACIPLSRLWDLVYQIRREAYRFQVIPQNYFKVPIISVGNINFGGTGKTPFTIWLSEKLIQRNLNVLVLMRGYKGKLEHSVGVIKQGKIGHAGTGNPADFGDEAILISRRIPKVNIIVGKKRAKNLKNYYSEIKADVVVLDDGHQHLSVARDFNFVLFDATLPLSQYKTAPSGFLREGPSALKDAHAIVITKSNLVPPIKVSQLIDYIKQYTTKDVIFAEAAYRPIGVYSDHIHYSYRPQEIFGKKVICLAGIANPNAFFQTIDDLGADIIKTMAYPDHFSYTAKEIEELLTLAQQNNAIIITTEKDIVKIRKITDSKMIQFLEVGLEFLKGEKEILEKMEQLLKLKN